MRGIGPCYRDKAGRTHAIRVGDLCRPEFFRRRLDRDRRAQEPDPAGPRSRLRPARRRRRFAREYFGYAERLRPYVTDTTTYLHRALRDGKRLLFEGAQGSLLDVDHGTFPFVTSSNSSGCGVHNGSGVSERGISKMIGVVKAYSTARRRRSRSSPSCTTRSASTSATWERVRHDHAAVRAAAAGSTASPPATAPA